jgi:hypothetical protein
MFGHKSKKRNNELIDWMISGQSKVYGVREKDANIELLHNISSYIPREGGEVTIKCSHCGHESIMIVTPIY